MASGHDREILVTMIQGPEASRWAKQIVGWESESIKDGKLHSMMGIYFLSSRNLMFLIAVCSWDGVSCDPTDLVVTEINLAMAGIKGTIPSELGLILSLHKLNLFGNQLSGTVPSEVLALPLLDSVHLGKNRLSGGFPLFRSSNIKVLEVEGNQFGGLLPEQLAGAYPGMIQMDLSNNSFSGTLPEDLCRMTTLNKLSLAFNRFHGLIPHDLGKLTNLEGLFLNDNSFYGPIPSPLADGGMRLVQLFLQHNALSGTIPGALSEINTLSDFFVYGKIYT
jgi:hypothetical protein